MQKLFGLKFSLSCQERSPRTATLSPIPCCLCHTLLISHPVVHHGVFEHTKQSCLIDFLLKPSQLFVPLLLLVLLLLLLMPPTPAATTATAATAILLASLKYKFHFPHKTTSNSCIEVLLTRCTPIRLSYVRSPWVCHLAAHWSSLDQNIASTPLLIENRCLVKSFFF